MQTIKPSRTYIFARPADSVAKTASGILLTEKNAEKPKTATVINVGAMVKDYEADDVIVYKSYSTSDIKLNGDEYILLSEDDVIGKVLEVTEEK